MNSEEIIKLVLELTGTQSLADAQAKINALKTEVVETIPVLARMGDGYEMAAKQAGAAAMEQTRAQKLMGAASDKAVAAAMEQTRAQKLMGGMLEETSRKQVKAAGEAGQAVEKSSGAATAGMMNLSNGIADFIVGAQMNGLRGGLMGISNNLGGIAGMLGLGAGVAGGLIMLGSVLPMVIPPIREFIGSWGTEDKFPKILQGVAALGVGVAAAKTRIEELEKASKWNTKDLAEYNELLAAQVIQEEKITKLKKEQADYKKLMETKSTETEKERKGLAKVFDDVLGGHGKEVQGGLMVGLDADPETRDKRGGLNAHIMGLRKTADEIEAMHPEQADQMRKQADASERELKELGLAQNQRVESLMARGAGGDRDAIRQMAGIMPAGANRDKMAHLGAATDYRTTDEQAKAERDTEKEEHGWNEADNSKWIASIDDQITKATALPDPRAAETALEGIIRKIMASHINPIKKNELIDKARKAIDEVAWKRREKQADDVSNVLKGKVDQVAKEGSVDEETTAYAAQVRAQGGAVDRFGRFHKLNAEQQAGHVVKEAEKQLGRSYPQMHADERHGIAQSFGDSARDQVEDHARAATATASREGLNANAATLLAMRSYAQEMALLAQKARQQAMLAKNLQTNSESRTP